jgi:hypothetical protein
MVGMRGKPGATFANFTALATTPQNAPASFNENFSAANYPGGLGGQLSSYWQNQTGDMMIVNGKATGQSALNLATLNGLNQANVTVQAALSVHAGQSAGLVARYQGGNMYYGAIVSSGSGFVAQIWIYKGGVWTLLKQKSIGASGQGTLTFKAIGSSLQLFWNNVLVVSATDTRLTTGTVGLRESQGAAAGNFSVS